MDKLTIYIDGGSRGNPGPAAAGVVIQDSTGQTIFAGGFYLGRATNNVAEYSGLLKGLHHANELGASDLEVVSDSELLVKQMRGEYRVKNEGLKALFGQARALLTPFKSVRFRHVRRELNKQADKLVNQALDGSRDVRE